MLYTRASLCSREWPHCNHRGRCVLEYSSNRRRYLGDTMLIEGAPSEYGRFAKTIAFDTCGPSAAKGTAESKSFVEGIWLPMEYTCPQNDLHQTAENARFAILPTRVSKTGRSEELSPGSRVVIRRPVTIYRTTLQILTYKLSPQRQIIASVIGLDESASRQKNFRYISLLLSLLA